MTIEKSHNVRQFPVGGAVCAAPGISLRPTILTIIISGPLGG
jgi:hypothetical protein